ncbi:MAG: hypothetical protein Q4E52_07245 [Fibrobacter sp.]|nr:hypothetical protein [Fibrobacter sp.]
MNENLRDKISAIEKKLGSFSADDIECQNKLQRVQVELEHSQFHAAYKKELCYLCGDSFENVDETKPCLHIFLRRKMFKKGLYEQVLKNFQYFQVASYLRWVSNEETPFRNVNDLNDERAENKIFNETIAWKNIEWTFDCSQSDFDGHKDSENGKNPHWHFQMKMDGHIFIKFNDYHIDFKEKDLITFGLVHQGVAKHSFGGAGAGLQEIMDFAEDNPKDFLDNSMSARECEDKAVARIQTIVSAPPGQTISGGQIAQAFELSKKTGKTLVACLCEVLNNKCSTSVVVSPHEGVPEIAKRGKRK